MANQALIQSGKALYDQSAEQVDYAGAFAEGSKMVTDQIKENTRQQREAEDREYELRKMQDEEQLRKIGLEQKIEAYQQAKAVDVNVIQNAFDAGLLKEADYPGYTLGGTNWIKDQANQLKIIENEGDLATLRSRLKGVTAAKQNFGALLDYATTTSISDSSPQAQKIDMALDAWREKGGELPNIVTEGGEDYFVIPSADGQEDIKLPVNKLSGDNPQSVYGEYNEMADFNTTMADWQSSNPKLYDKLVQGTATKGDIDGIGYWFLEQVKNNPVKSKEILDSFFISSGITPGSEIAQELGVTDQNGDGKITSADIRDVDMAEVFQGAVMANSNFAPEQIGDKVFEQARDKVLGRGGTGVSADVTATTRLTTALETNNFSDLQGLTVKTGVKGEYIQNVFKPGDKYGEDGKEATEYLVQTSKGNVLRLGKDPQKGFSNILGIKVTSAQLQAEQKLLDQADAELDAYLKS